MTRSDAAVVRALLRAAERRLTISDLATGGAAGFAVAAGFAFVGWPTRASGLSPLVVGVLLAVLVGVATAVVRRRRGLRAPSAVERGAPASRNLLFTAGELANAPVSDASGTKSPAESYASRQVLANAARFAGAVNLASAVPLFGRIAGVMVAASLWIATVARATGGSLAGPALSVMPVIDAVEFAVESPAYAAKPVRIVRNPDRLDVLAGSRIAIVVRTNGSAVSLLTLDTSRALIESAPGTFAGTFVAVADGFVAFEPRAAQGIVGARRRVGLSIVPDLDPRVSIVAPGRDLVLPHGKRTIQLAIDASDDIGLVSLKLRYTRVSGSGERFTFIEGEVPLDITRSSVGKWIARARWKLDTLALESGDMVVYKAVAADARPGAPSVESDAFIAEIASPGGVAAEGFSIDPDQERYAISQQMVILKTQRLIAKQRTLSPELFADEALSIAVEQRHVRAEFVFMMGGEMNDGGLDAASLDDLNEEEEAAREDELLGGREANQGQLALRRAIVAMSLAARSLTTADAATALTHERAALIQLERAFSSRRIILRALSVRESLDSARRLSGDLSETVRFSRTIARPDPDARAVALRSLLGELFALSGAGAGAGAPVDAARALPILAERVLRIDPSEPALQEIARTMSSGSESNGSREQVARAAAAISAEMRRLLPASPTGGKALDAMRSSGALVDLLRRSTP